MIVLPKHELVIITPPHTASGNLHWCLCSPEWGGYWVVGPNRDGGMDHHFAQMIGGWKHFRSVLIIRHPLNRLTGLYLHYKWDKKRKNKPYVGWNDFVLAAYKKSHITLGCYIFYTTIEELIDFNPDIIIRYNSIEYDLTMLLGSTVKLKEKYHPTVNMKEYYKDDRIIELAIKWGLNDCCLFELDALDLNSE